MADEQLNPRTARVRESLMAAARDLVAEHPVEAISVTEVAAAAGTSRRMVYEHFGDLNSLVAQTALERQRDILAPIVGDDGGDVRAYMEGVLGAFVAGVYAERSFFRNAMHGPCAYLIVSGTVRMLDEAMRDRVLGGRIAPSGAAADDRRYAVAAGVVALVVRWLDSEFTGDDAPERMASRLLNTMLGLAGVAN